MNLHVVPFGVVAFTVAGCGGPPPSQVPSGQAAIDRMRASYGCEVALQVDEAKVDALGDGRRLRTDVMMFAAGPARFRLDAKTPVVGDVAAVLTSDGKDLVFTDRRSGRVDRSPATATAMQHLVKIPVPPAILVTLLLGHAPVLRHTTSSVRWSAGHYVVSVDGNDDSHEEIDLAVSAEDWDKPWSQQRLRPVRVHVAQAGIPLYDVELDDPQPTPMASMPQSTGLATALGTPPTVATGPVCTNAKTPRRLRVTVPTSGEDVLLRLDKVALNPWIDPGVFAQ